MALTEDQKAMLRLLAQREEGYEDIAALMGTTVEDVRVRVKEALAEVEESGMAAAEPPQPPAEPAPSSARPAPDPEPAPPKAEEPAPPAPAAAEPAAPAQAQAAPKPRMPRRRPAKRPATPEGLRLPKDRGALIGLGAGALAVVALAVVLALSDSGDSGSTVSSTTPTASEGTNASTSNPNLTEAILSPTDGGDASGRALFGRFKKNVLLQVEAEGLDPAPSGETYTVWLYRSPKLALRIGSVPLASSGKIAAQLPIPTELLAYVAGGAFNQVDLALTPTADYKAAVAKAKSEKSLPPYIGESVLRGEITGPAIKKQ